MSIIARLGVWLGLNTTEFVKGLDEATKKTREFEKNNKKALKEAEQAMKAFMATAATGMAAAAAAALAVGNAFKYADEIEDTAAAYDVTTEALISLQAAMQGAGGEANNIGTALQKLATAQQSAIDGSDEMRKSFSELKISGKDVESLNLEDLFKRVAQELAQVEDAGKRAALQQEILGKAMKGVDVRQFVDKYKEVGNPELAAAIKENAKAWEAIEVAMKNIAYAAQIAVAPLAKIINSYDQIIKKIKQISEFSLGLASVTEFGVTNYNLPDVEEKDSDKPVPIIAPSAQQGGYSALSAKDKSAANKAAEEAKRRKEARAQLELEIKLIKDKADIADKMFAINVKGITQGEAAIAQEKMRLNLASDLAQIRNNAAKERNKENAQIDLINAKEKAEINARIKQFNNEDSLRQKAFAHQHQITMQNIDTEYKKQENINDAEYEAIDNLLSLEKEKFKLGEATYELRKLEVEEANELERAGARYSNTLIDIQRAYDLSAKSAEDEALRQKNMQLADQQYQEERIKIVAIQKARSTILAQEQKRNHDITINAIKNETALRSATLRQETDNTIELIDLERQRFDLGSAAYAQKKLDIEYAQEIKKIQDETKQKIKELNEAYELTGKTLHDLMLLDANKNKILENQVIVTDSIVRLYEKRKDATKEQFDLEDKMFNLDLAQQKGREIANIQENLKIEKERLGLESKRYLMSANEYNLSNLKLENALRLAEIEKKYNDQIKEAKYQMERQGGGQSAREEYEKRIKNIEQIRDAELNANKQINNARQQNLEKEIERQKSFVEGWEYASRQFTENAQNAFNRGAAAFSTVMSSMDSAISNFVETGKFKFEDFALGIIRDLLRIEMQAQASMLFQSMVGFFSPAAPMVTPANGVVAFRQKASGGYIDAPTIVGENGAELFVPNMPGTVIPNGSWQQAAANMNKGGFTNNGTYIANMSAIDTQSATQFLASNKNTIWAAYQSANRSVPISR